MGYDALLIVHAVRLNSDCQELTMKFVAEKGRSAYDGGASRKRPPS